MENVLCDFIAETTLGNSPKMGSLSETMFSNLEYVRYGLVILMVARGVPVVPNKFPVFLFAVLVFHRGKPAGGPPLRLGFFPVRFPVVPLFVLQTFLLCRGHFQFSLLQGTNVWPQTAVSANQGFLLLDWQSLQCL